jgi:hypothetical protein
MRNVRRNYERVKRRNRSREIMRGGNGMRVTERERKDGEERRRDGEKEGVCFFSLSECSHVMSCDSLRYDA